MNERLPRGEWQPHPQKPAGGGGAGGERAARGARRVLGVALAVLAPLALAASAAAVSPGAPPAELEHVRRQVASLEQRLRELTARQAEVGRERERAETELALAEARVREAETERGRVLAAEAAAAAEVSATMADVERAAEKLRSQITLLAMLGRGGLSPLLLHAAATGGDLSERVTVLLALVREQKLRRDELSALAERRVQALGALSARRAELDEASRLLFARRAELELTRTRVRGELAGLERQRRVEAARLADAQEAEGRLERLWGVVARDGVTEAFDVRLLRGGLPWPLEGGRVVRGFGPQRDARYGTLTVSHGLMLDAPLNARVKAIAEGRVVYAQFFKGYGNLVILHHGRNIHSLYGQLASMLVRAGQRVAIGEEVGVVGAVDEDPGNFYLEVRVGQQAENPLGWLKPAGR